MLIREVTRCLDAKFWLSLEIAVGGFPKGIPDRYIHDDIITMHASVYMEELMAKPCHIRNEDINVVFRQSIKLPDSE